MRRWLARVAIVALVVCLYVTTSVGDLLASEESTAISLINGERTSRGLNSLQESGSLSSYAAKHSQVMADAGEIFHSSNLGSAASGWEALGENVGQGGSATSLHGAFMNSAGHRDNILGNWTHIGVGTVSQNGYLFITVIFMRRGEVEVTTTTTPPTTSQAATTTSAPRGLHVPAPATECSVWCYLKSPEYRLQRLADLPLHNRVPGPR